MMNRIKTIIFNAQRFPTHIILNTSDYNQLLFTDRDWLYSYDIRVVSSESYTGEAIAVTSFEEPQQIPTKGFIGWLQHEKSNFSCSYMQKLTHLLADEDTILTMLQSIRNESMMLIKRGIQQDFNLEVLGVQIIHAKSIKGALLTCKS